MAIYRDKKNAILGGVFASISDKTGVNVWVVRLVMCILIFGSGMLPGLFIYLLLCAFIPRKGNKNRANSEDVPSYVSNQAKNETTSSHTNNQGYYKTPPSYVQNKREVAGTCLKIKEISNQINYSCNSILSRNYTNKVASGMLDEFKEKILEFKDYSPKLENQYNQCLVVLKANNMEEIIQSIEENKKRMMMSPAGAKRNYQSIIEQKEIRLKYLGQIKEYKEIIESKLQLILDTIKNIEVSILQTELKTQVDDSNYSDMQQHISVLSESISEVSDIYKRTKIRI